MADKPRLVDFYRNMVGVLNFESPNIVRKDCGDFPTKFYVTSPSPGAFVILQEVRQGIVAVSDRGAVAQAVSQYIDRHMEALGAYLWTAKQLEAFVNSWIYVTPTIAMPKSWAWADDPGLTFNRLPWTTATTGPTPLWDELTGRMDNEEAFRQWIGSLFIPESYRQQYVWMHGEGGDGKGAIHRFLAKVFGNAHINEVVPCVKNNFWTYGLLGRRVVSFADTNDAGFPATGLFKSISGGDGVRMEIKKGASFTANIDSKFIFSSQERPRLSSEAADMRRVILIEVRPRADKIEDSSYEDRLFDEGGNFLSSCMAVYRAACPKHERIKPDTAAIEDWVQRLEEYNDAILDECFDMHPEAYVPATQFTRIVMHITRGDMRKANDFRKWLERAHGIKSKTLKRDGKVLRGYVGLGVDPAYLKT